MGLSRTRNIVDSLPSRIHQRSFHSKCRHHPYRFLSHGRSRTCPLVILSFRPLSHGSTKLHRRPSTPHEDFLPSAPSFDETPPLKTAQAPENPDHSICGKALAIWHTSSRECVSKRWRSGTLLPETPRSDHSAFTGTVACRCPACLASISKAP